MHNFQGFLERVMIVKYVKHGKIIKFAIKLLPFILHLL